MGQLRDQDGLNQIKNKREELKSDSITASKFLESVLYPELEYRFDRSIIRTQKQIQLRIQRLTLMKSRSHIDQTRNLNWSKMTERRRQCVKRKRGG